MSEYAFSSHFSKFLGGNASLKMMRKMEDTWLAWNYRRLEDKVERGDVQLEKILDEENLTMREWNRAKRMASEMESTLNKLDINWETREGVERLRKYWSTELNLEKKCFSGPFLKEAKCEEKTRVIRMVGPKYSKSVYLTLSLACIMAMMSVMTEAKPSLQNWMTIGDSKVRPCNGLVQFRSVDDKKYGYTDVMWDHCCLHAINTADPDSEGFVCEIHNSMKKENVEYKKFDLKVRGIMISEGKDCIEMIELCKRYSADGTLTRILNESAEEIRIVAEESKRSIKPEYLTYETANVTMGGQIIEELDITHDGCYGLESNTHDIRTILNRELCIVHCHDKEGHPEISFDQKSDDGFQRKECWEMTYTDWMDEDENIARMSLIGKKYKGGHSLKYCYFTTCLGKNSIDSSFSIWMKEDRSTDVRICEECINHHFPHDCIVSIRSTHTDVIIDMKSNVGVYHIMLGDERRDGYFVDQRSVTIEIKGSGSVFLHGYCNDRKFTRKIITTTEEYCNEKYSGLTEKVEQIYCKQHRLIKNLVICIIILMIFYFGKEVLGFFMGAVSSGIFLLFTIFLTRKIICRICSEVTFLGVGHRCSPTKCIYCGCTVLTEQMITDSTEVQIKTYINEHQRRRCPKYVSSNLLVLSLMNYFRIFSNVYTQIFRKAPAIAICITLIWLSSVLFKEADALTIEESLRIEEKLRNDNLKNKANAEAVNGRCFEKSIVIFISLLVINIILFITKNCILELHLFMSLKRGKEICKQCGALESNQKNGKVHVCEGSLSLIERSSMSNKNVIENELHVMNMTHRAKLAYKKRTASNMIKAMGCTNWILTVIIIMELIHCVSGSHYNEMKKAEEDMGDFIKELKREGFHPYHARFSGGLRESISAIREEKECKTGVCKIIMEIKAEIVVKEGREFGYKVRNKSNKNNMEALPEIDLNMKTTNLKSHCFYKHVYETGPVRHHQFSGDTCTEGCAMCQKRLSIQMSSFKGERSEVYEVNHENTASWSCDGPGCIAINNGCTCGKCFCSIENERAYVLELVKEEQSFDLCIQVGGEGYCKEIRRDTKAGRLSTLEYASNLNKCPKMVVNFSGKFLTGVINKLGEFDNKFGSVQKIGETVTSKREERYQEHCLFMKHRYMTFTQCCKDTFHMIKNLDVIHFQENREGELVKEEPEIGAWKINLVVPTLSYTEQKDVLSLSDMKIEDCMGCHKCEEGGSCLLSYKSSHDATVHFECEGCVVDTNNIFLKRGLKTTPFNVFCPSEEGVIECKVNGLPVRGGYKLIKQPNKPHGDGYIRMDKEKFIHEECNGVLCGLEFPSLNLLGWVKWAILCIVTVVGIMLTIWTIKIAYSFFKKIQ